MLKISMKGLVEAIAAEVSRVVVPKDLRPMRQEIGEYMTNVMRYRFRNSVGPDGEKWKPTVMGNKPLIKSGGLMKDMTSFTVGGNQYDFWLKWGTTKWWAKHHQFGYNKRIYPKTKKALWWPGLPHPVASTKGIPARPFVGFNQENLRRLTKIVLAHLTRKR